MPYTLKQVRVNNMKEATARLIALLSCTTYSNSTKVFYFTLHANVSGYTSPCHSVRSGEASSRWTLRDERTDEFGACLGFSPNYYIAVNHTPVCDLSEDESDPRYWFARVIATGDGRLLVGLVDTSEGQGYSTRFSAGDPWAMPATVDSAAAPPDSPALIDPDARRPCPISYRDDWFPPETRPSTAFRFRFDKNRNDLVIA
ncbi:uncharacterized protein F4807DRAFT_464070 [Annulohypoxylon truncatum]|uniref:uncharacterized protein n=1 Tax=Annulohypoxylon truncatum TaxID=327061 RepID=UPI0020088076|nr:uncharacterized protein F4807DRAFT_464070 [Annulohypoxylon truncatum]KAI1206060.1 hypothetical protein F4807DRAFT_464070 [Annulohypoxylon truncatum]